MNSIHF